MELCASVDLAVAAHSIANTLSIPHNQVHLYSDSKVVLGYLSNKTKKFSIYVTRRINLILKQLPENQWHYIASNLNPADIASRPQTPTALHNSCWIIDPAFLYECSLPPAEKSHSIDSLPEEKSSATVMKIDASANISVVSKLLNYCSTFTTFLTHLCYILSYLLRIHDLVQQKNGLSLAPRLSISKDEALVAALKQVQMLSFPNLFSALTSKSINQEANELASLSPFMDDAGILRVGVRLSNSSLPHNMKHPILLPEKHPISPLIVHHYHNEVKHQGRNTRIAAIRSAGYFIIHLSKLVKRQINNCITCKRLRGQFLNQRMSDLP